MPDDLVGSSPAPEGGEEPTPQGATLPEPAPPQAPAQQQQQPPFHLHPRFRELTTENRELKGQVQQLVRQMQEFQRLQAEARSGGLNTEESRQLSEAAAALKKVFAADPELRAFFEARKSLPYLTQGYQQLTEGQRSSQREQARGYVAQLAKEEGLPADPKWLAHLVRLTAGQAMSLEQGNERFEAGDMTVLKEAFDAVKADFIAALKTAGVANTQTTKTKLKGLPPAPRGSAAGSEAPKPIEEGKEREFTQGLHKRGLAMLKEQLSG